MLILSHFGEGRMSSEPHNPELTMDPRSLRGPESWVLAAFLALFSVAVAAAMPQISVAVRAAVDGSKSAHGTADAKDRSSVRVRGIVIRALTPKASGSSLAIVAPPSSAVAQPLSPRATVLHVDLAAQIRARGIAARAPPALSA